MSTRKKIMLAFGTRPEAIKMAPLYHALKSCEENFETVVCLTAQHRQMLDQVLSVFNIDADIDLNLMKPGQDLFDVTSSVLLHMRSVLKEHKPDMLLVHGDTTTSLAAGMAAFYLGIPLGHVEAGLRTFDVHAPFPEEFNRQVVSKISQLHFAPTEQSKDNLLNENVLEKDILVTGNTVIDALFWVLHRIDSDPVKYKALCDVLSVHLPFNWKEQCYILITGHRRENFGSGFLQICEALKDLANKYPDVNFVYPVHLNPQVQEPVNAILNNLNNVHLIPPLDYEPFVMLLKHSYIVLTDSGGIQEEAPSLGKPVLVMRDVTERPEAVAAGTVKLVGADRAKIIEHVSILLDDSNHYEMMSKAHNPYGDGSACERIISALKRV
ncbi:UDP-N-acetylglucosamine 2-epimerase (non-hydrolyzing) [Chromobacterium violaceum]|uniref:UDP-N-acetylglucosamine 2-epimerase (non-hydrolyzing) n=3 Tax=Chromobacterium violaceum TaxID=536 RepID=Q7NQW6_CHRVO|nr:UDP-N-acetylglucosamine 2-epimerase (non-hydrolyzing) [Chromobacterium violaceum]AAQ61681.1 UDP-N-acetylglucosamine 2-epimerase [Chromobacterium violaceum ATCC 12472]MBA8736597.1 UDP-N-acetylglucosamine 2-epimerase (non-hydrolyzing) [Chromobacterium violaceum]OVE46528.1 UDP-N-acetylglucosamine 2-epimerase (non-hydrolyzing) [Chromobacterium violaceum]